MGNEHSIDGSILYDIDVPILDLGRYTGWTDYIDFIKWDQVTSPIK